MSIRVSAVALVGYDHDHLHQILNQWLSEGFEVDGPCRDFAYDLLDKLDLTAEFKPREPFAVLEVPPGCAA